MEQNKSNIERLLEMLDNPEAYTEQEILDIVNADEQTREAYRLMTIAKRASLAKQAAARENEIDVDEAWHRFEQRYLTTQRQHQSLSWVKMAALIAGIIFISGIAVAAVRGYFNQERHQEQQAKEVTALPGDSLVVTMDNPDKAEPVSFDNEPLEEILNEMAAYYHVEIVFKDNDVRQLRFHYEWKPDAGLSAAIDGLNHFKRVNIEINSNRLIVSES